MMEYFYAYIKDCIVVLESFPPEDRKKVAQNLAVVFRAVASALERFCDGNYSPGGWAVEIKLELDQIRDERIKKENEDDAF